MLNPTPDQLDRTEEGIESSLPLASMSNLISDSIMVLHSEEMEILRFARNGDIFVKGNLVTNDLEVVEGFRELLRINHLIN